MTEDLSFSQGNQPDQPYAALNSSQLSLLDVEDTIESIVSKNTSLQTKALYELADDMAEAADDDVTVLGRRKVEEDEESRNTSSSTRDGVSARVLKRTRLTSNEKTYVLDVGCRMIRESRRLAQVRNETLRLKTMAQFMLIRSMLVCHEQPNCQHPQYRQQKPPIYSVTQITLQVIASQFTSFAASIVSPLCMASNNDEKSSTPAQYVLLLEARSAQPKKLFKVRHVAIQANALSM
ncbi:hypothetical protein BGX21_010254 [Mortierella sp. AD011]|nr:hypothetical protein BGX20_002133 [Mortierella sp. AD010]KAF9402391.1 hypothetical protein BGX21_010254 [Mortierella sp. AD011]